MVAIPVTVMVCAPSGVAPESGPGALHPVIAAPAASMARITRNNGQPLRERRKRLGMMSRKSPASAVTRSLADMTEAVVAGLGGVVCTTSVELHVPPLTVAGEKLQLEFAGNWVQLRAIGKLQPGVGVMVTV